VSKFIAEKVNLEDVSERNESHLLRWMSNINDTISFLNDLVESDEFKKNTLSSYMDYSKVAAISISISVGVEK
jgi:hypothetical protein